MRAATVVQQVCKSCRTCCKFYCMFYFTCDRSFSPAYKAGSLRTPRLPCTKPTYRPLPHKCETQNPHNVRLPIRSTFKVLLLSVQSAYPAPLASIPNLPGFSSETLALSRKSLTYSISLHLYESWPVSVINGCPLI